MTWRKISTVRFSGMCDARVVMTYAAGLLSDFKIMILRISMDQNKAVALPRILRHVTRWGSYETSNTGFRFVGGNAGWLCERTGYTNFRK